MTSIENSGIWVSGGGQVSADAIAVGAGARANSNTDSSEGRPSAFTELDDMLTELIGVMRQTSGQIADSDALIDTAERARDELASGQPNRHVLLGLLAGLAGGVASIDGLVESVRNIQESIANLL